MMIRETVEKIIETRTSSMHKPKGKEKEGGEMEGEEGEVIVVMRVGGGRREGKCNYEENWNKKNSVVNAIIKYRV